MRDIDQKPNREMIREVYDTVQTYWAPQFDKDVFLEALHDNEHSVDAPDTTAEGRVRKIQPERMNMSEAARVVNVVRALYVSPSTIEMEWVGEGQTGKRKGEKVGAGINELINQLNPPKNAPLNTERFWMVLLGRAARLICPGDAYYWDFPYKKAGETLDQWTERYESWKRKAPVPLVWRDLLPQNTFPATFGRMEEELVSWMDVAGHDLEEMFSEREIADLDSDKHKDDNGHYRLVLFSNCQWLGYTVLGKLGGDDDLLLRTYETKMGVPAIRILHGVTGGRREPAKWWQSVLEPVLDLIPQTDRRFSEAATASKFDALPLFKWWGHGGTQASEIQKFFEGDMIPLQQQQATDMPREDIEPLFHPEFGEKTMALAQFGLQRCEQLTGAVEALEGAFGPAGQPAWSRNFVVDVAKAKFSPLTSAVVGADIDAAEMIMRSVAAWDQPIRIPARAPVGKHAAPKITINPKDMENFRPSIKGEYQLRAPLNRRADYDLGISMLERIKNSKLPVPMTLPMEQLLGIEDPYRAYEEALQWEYLTSDEVRAFQTKRLAKDMALDLADEEGMAVDEFMREAASWDPALRQAVMASALGEGGAMGEPPEGAMPMPTPAAAGPGGGSSFFGSGGLGPDAQGAVRAGTPFIAEPGGPQPA